MKNWFFIILFLGMILVDISVLGGGIGIIPPLSLAFLVTIFLFAKKRDIYLAFAIFGLVIWLFSNINVGVIVVSIGVLLFYEQWLLYKVFHGRTSHVMIAAALGIPLFMLVLFGASALFTDSSLWDRSRTVMLVVTTMVAVLFNFMVKYLNERYA